jgi:hypothetical protein
MKSAAKFLLLAALVATLQLPGMDVMAGGLAIGGRGLVKLRAGGARAGGNSSRPLVGNNLGGRGRSERNLVAGPVVVRRSPPIHQTAVRSAPVPRPVMAAAPPAGPIGPRPAIGPQSAPQSPKGDLELVEIRMLNDSTDELGPLYELTIRNSGRAAAENFRVSLVAVLGQITTKSPSVTFKVDHVGPGESETLQVQLPGAVLSMGHNGLPLAFDSLVVAVDSFDELTEENEQNNTATLQRTAIPTVVADEPAFAEIEPAIASEEQSVAQTSALDSLELEVAESAVQLEE